MRVKFGIKIVLAGVCCVILICPRVHSQQVSAGVFVLPEPSYFEYAIDCSTSDMADKQAPDAPQTYHLTGTRDTGESCSKVLTTEYLNRYITTREVVLDSSIPNKIGGRTKPVDLVPENVSQSLWLLKDCCGGSTCSKGCFEYNTKCVVRVWSPDDSKHRMFFKGWCNLCLQKGCNNICQNGQFAEAYMTKDGVNSLLDSTPVCKACLAGTFNTCFDKETCSW